nr:MAG TPA: hypothetical protein [Caudoviricetes sp.]
MGRVAAVPTPSIPKAACVPARERELTAIRLLTIPLIFKHWR